LLDGGLIPCAAGSHDLAKYQEGSGIAADWALPFAQVSNLASAHIVEGAADSEGVTWSTSVDRSCWIDAHFSRGDPHAM